MGDILAAWISVGGDQMFERTEIFTSKLDSSFELFVSAPFGGPILVRHENVMRVNSASGQEISKWRWKTGGKIVCSGWSLEQQLVFVLEDGTVLIHSIFGELLKSTSMGQEAKDVKVKDGRIFRSRFSTGVAVLTSSNRFFVVNNLKEPRVRRFFDADVPQTKWPWAVLAFERHARVICSPTTDALTMISLSEATRLDLTPIDGGGFTNSRVNGNNRAKLMAVSMADNSLVALYFTNGRLWIGRVDDNAKKLAEVMLDSTLDISELVWCGSDAVLAFSPETSQCVLATVSGSTETTFLPGFVAAVSEIDSARLFTLYSQELIRCVPPTLERIFSIGSASPAAKLRLASEEYHAGSHRADEYVRCLDPGGLDTAVKDCIRAAGLVHDIQHQKCLMKAAQFGRAFCPPKCAVNAADDSFSLMARTLRVLNALRQFKVGIPLTLAQHDYLTVPVIIDRLLVRRLFPLAAHICQFLQIPRATGHSRVLAHWACYKVSLPGADDNEVAKAIEKRVGAQKAPLVSYSDIASKAIECGKNKLAIRLLESESSVKKQVPLLIRLGEQSAALNKALASGDKDLAYSVIIDLKKGYNASDFHMLIRKYPLGRILYENFCGMNDPGSLEDWHIQEDNYEAQAMHELKRAAAATRSETRLAILVNTQQLLRKGKLDGLASLVDENSKLLKSQVGLEEKLGQTLAGLTLHQTLTELVKCDELKAADKLRQEFKLTDRRYTWIKLTTWAKGHKWAELKKYGKQKKLAVPMKSVVKLAREHGGSAAADQFLASNEFVSNEDRFGLFSEFGQYAQAAAAAFDGRNMDALDTLEALCASREDILKTISGFKAQLIGVGTSASWR